MTNCNPGEIVLVRFPFTHLQNSKRRPALIVSPSDYTTRYGDVLILALTSQPQPEDNLCLHNWRAAGLPKPTWCKPLLATISAELIMTKLGTIHTEDRQAPLQAMTILLAREFYFPSEGASR